MNLEDALREALRREEPPTGFADRVLDRVAQLHRTSMSRSWMAIAAMLVLGALGTFTWERYETARQTTAREAGQQLVLALKVTGRMLHSTQRMIRRRTNGV